MSYLTKLIFDTIRCIGEDEERKRRKCHFQGLCKNTDFACLSHNYQLQEDSKDLGSFFFFGCTWRLAWSQSPDQALNSGPQK